MGPHGSVVSLQGIAESTGDAEASMPHHLESGTIAPFIDEPAFDAVEIDAVGTAAMGLVGGFAVESNAAGEPSQLAFC